MYVRVLYILYCAAKYGGTMAVQGHRVGKGGREGGRGRDTCVTYKIYSNGTDIAVCVCVIL